MTVKEWLSSVERAGLGSALGIEVRKSFEADTGKAWGQLVHAAEVLDRAESWPCIMCIDAEPDAWLYDGKIVPEGTPGAKKFHNSGWLAGVCGNPESRVVSPWQRHSPEERARRLDAWNAEERGEIAR